MNKYLKLLCICILGVLLSGCESNPNTTDIKNDLKEMQRNIYEKANSEADTDIRDIYEGDSLIGEAAYCKIETFELTKKEIYSPDVSFDEIPKEKEIIYFNRLTGKDETVMGKLVKTGIENSAVWNRTITGEIIFETDNENSDEWITDDGKTVKMSLDGDSPQWDTMANDLQKYCNTKDGEYKLSRVVWTTDKYKSEGKWKRKAEYTLTCSAKGKYALYECEVKGMKEVIDARRDNADLKLLKEYRKVNEDVTGIIRIPDTSLNHPIAQNAEKEGFYLWHDLNGDYNSHGVPFMAGDENLTDAYGNRIIYGHRLSDKDVFGELPEYEDLEYYKAHPIIETVSDEGTSKWLIIACFNVNNSDEDAFEYYLSGNFISKKEYEDYMTEVDKRNWFAVPFEYNVWNNFITLSTCSKQRNPDRTNRLVVMGVQIPYDMDTEDIVSKVKYTENSLLQASVRR